jgi:MFS family permease
MTTLSGWVKNYVQLLLARIGVGVGEAGGSPPAHAMISDYFPPEKRATALSFYSSGIYFGILIGYLMGGYLNQQLGWRTAFYLLGIPGIVFSLFFYATVKEPRRGATDVNSPTTGTHAMAQVLKLLYSKKVFVFLAVASGLHAFCIYALVNWMPSFLARLHGMKNTDIGIALGLILGITGILGTYMGGLLTDYFGKKDKRWYLKVPAYAILLSILFVIGILFWRDTFFSLACLGVCNFLYSMYLGPVIAVSHMLVPASMRALTSSILFLVINLVGLGFGPLVVGVISDLLAPSMGAESLRWAMSCIIVVSGVSALLFFGSAKKIEEGIKPGQSEPQTQP